MWISVFGSVPQTAKLCVISLAGGQYLLASGRPECESAGLLWKLLSREAMSIFLHPGEVRMLVDPYLAVGILGYMLYWLMFGQGKPGTAPLPHSRV